MYYGDDVTTLILYKNPNLLRANETKKKNFENNVINEEQKWF